MWHSREQLCLFHIPSEWSQVYSRVCGKIKAYQCATTDAFIPYYINNDLTIDDLYVEGVCLTHGQTPRNHIWTFASAVDEVHSNEYVCPCTKTDTPYTGEVPPFIGQDYFCDTVVGISTMFGSTAQILSGMAQAVAPLAAAVASTTHHGSVNNYHNQPQMT